MSTNQQKRRREADNPSPAPKRTRLLASSTAGAAEAEPVDLEESDTVSFELAGEEFVALTAEPPESEDTDPTGDGSVEQQEQNQKQPLVSRAAENSAVLLASDEEVKPRDDDGALSSATLSSPVRLEEYSEWEQDQQHSLVSGTAENPVLLSDGEEELGDNDGPLGPLTSVLYEDRFLWEPEQNQPDPFVSRAADNSAVLLATDDEEELGDNNGALSSATLSSPVRLEEYSELLEEWEQQRSLLLSDISVLNSDGEATDNDQYATDSASEEEDSSEEETESSDAWPAGTIIRCPICMDFYPEIMQTERLILSTFCGHVFCSQCLPIAIETAGFCPTCRTELTAEQYHPIYL